jgi:hypothetical protein
LPSPVVAASLQRCIYTSLEIDAMVGHQLRGMCCNERLVKVGTAPAKGTSTRPARPLTESEVLIALMFAWCTVEEAKLDPQDYDSKEEYLRDTPKQPDNWSELLRAEDED